MTHPNDLISPCPHVNFDGTIQHDIHQGLTKREYFAAMRKPESINPDFVTLVMGKEAPPLNTMEYFQYYIEALEKLSVMHADALIKALNET